MPKLHGANWPRFSLFRRKSKVNVADIMNQTGALDSISRELGIDPGTARTGAEALLPAILGGFKKIGRAHV